MSLYLGSLSSRVFSSSHMSFTRPLFMFLYDTSIMKIKAGGLGGFLSCTETNKDHSHIKLDGALL